MNTAPVAQLVTTKPDTELAEEFKRRLVEAHEPLLKLLDEMKAAGFGANVGTSVNGLGKHAIHQLQVIKVY